MTSQQLTIFFVAFVTVLGIAFFPRIALRKQTMLTSEEISIRRPDLRGLNYKYGITSMVGLLIFIMLFFSSVYESQTKPVNDNLFLFLPFLLFLGLYEGIFALFTHVFPMTSRTNWNRFVYDRHDRYRWMAKLQVLLTAIGLILCLAILLF